ncbi:MAG: DUF2007 domain-containing protein [Muribaculaceae bacterium]|jgi:hypothetical protein|nr:DUF2007 domain-containing protein [Muribaculaceae bacterium]
MSDDIPLVTIARFSHDWEAHIAKGVLDEAGIPSVINNEIFGSVYPIGFNSIGGLTLLVRQSDADRARELLDHCPSGD